MINFDNTYTYENNQEKTIPLQKRMVQIHVEANKKHNPPQLHQSPWQYLQVEAQSKHIAGGYSTL